MLAIIIDYRDIYDRLKVIPANLTRDMVVFEKLYQWKMNDKREGKQHGD